MAGAKLIASGRGTFDLVSKAVTLPTPGAARRGDLLVALVAHSIADLRGSIPVGWAVTATLGAGTDALDVYARMVDDNEPVATGFLYQTVTSELQGEIIAIRGSAPGVFLEASATATFTATTTLATAGVTSQQAINLILVAWTCAGAPTLTRPVGFTTIDSFATAVVSARSMMVGIRVPGATGALAFPAASASVNATGRVFTLAIRDRIPVTPGVLEDLVPGNLGLIGKDTRAAR